jgi:hypothetical protein
MLTHKLIHLFMVLKDLMKLPREYNMEYNETKPILNLPHF